MTDGSIIGPGTVVRGNVRGEGSLAIYGRVEGDVTITGDVLLGEAAAVRGNITATQITVGGRVLGDLNGSDAVLIEGGARVVGDILAPRIGITSGALVRGNVRTEGEAALPQQQPRKAAAFGSNVHRLPQRPTGRAPEPRAADARDGVARSSEMRAEARPFERARPVETRRSEARVEHRPPPEPEATPDLEEETDDEAVESSPAAIAARSDSAAEGASENGRERPPPPVVPVLPKGAQAKKKSRKR